MAVNGDVKGKRYMRDICGHLHLWVLSERVTKQEDMAFRVRSTALLPTDGHWNGKGDILARPDLEFPFSVECKKIEGWEMDGALANAKWPAWSWWDQCVRQADACALLPMLIFTRNRREDYVMIPEGVAKCLALNVKTHGPQMRLEHNSYGRVRILLLRGLLLADYAAGRKRLRPMMKS